MKEDSWKRNTILQIKLQKRKNYHCNKSSFARTIPYDYATGHLYAGFSSLQFHVFQPWFSVLSRSLTVRFLFRIALQAAYGFVRNVPLIFEDYLLCIM